MQPFKFRPSQHLTSVGFDIRMIFKPFAWSKSWLISLFIVLSRKSSSHICSTIPLSLSRLASISFACLVSASLSLNAISFEDNRAPWPQCGRQHTSIRRENSTWGRLPSPTQHVTTARLWSQESDKLPQSDGTLMSYSLPTWSWRTGLRILSRIYVYVFPPSPLSLWERMCQLNTPHHVYGFETRLYNVRVLLILDSRIYWV